MFKLKLLLIMAVFTLFSLAECKKANATGNNNTPDEIKTSNKPNKTALLAELGGGEPREKQELIDGTITTLDLQKFSLSSFKGKVILLNLWATWCPPCRAEMPSMEKLYNHFKEKNFELLAVSAGESNDTVKKFIKKNPYSFKIFTDDNNEISSTYGTGSIPTSYLIDKTGYIVAQFVGGRDWYSQEAIDLIDYLLAE